MCRRLACSLPASTFAKILYVLPRSVIGLQLLSFAWSPDFGMRVIKPLLMKAEVAPSLSIAANAFKRSGMTSCAHSWKISMGTPSWPDALPFGKARMVHWISSRVRLLVRLVFVSLETLIGTFDQHCSRASAVPGA